tara:strand:- start:93 stop:356 length:264 start_codon:yes stop_codon:yes gene_type:complete
MEPLLRKSYIGNIFGKTNYDRVHVGDLVSWADISMGKRKRKGLVLKKWIYEENYSRKVAVLKVAEVGSDVILNILAINVKIESQITT